MWYLTNKNNYDIKIKNSSNAHDLNQDLLLLSLYSLIPPLRNEIKTLKFTEDITTQRRLGIF